MSNNKYKICNKTVMDTSDPNIIFDDNGVSNHAHLASWRLRNEVFSSGSAISFETWVDKIKKDGLGKKYDCLIGISGGVDSSIVACKVVELGLRPLAIHLDNGWNSELAVSNIEKIVKKLKLDYYTCVVRWREIKDLQRAYIEASVLDLECVSDHAINALMLRVANEHNIKYIIHGGNVKTESIMPVAWGYDKRDGKNVRAIHQKYGTIPLETYPIMNPTEMLFRMLVNRINYFPILNYMDYNKNNAIDELKITLGWTPYARKHGENRFTRFFQEYYLPTKFGIDKRRAHFSSLIMADQLKRDDALLMLTKPLYEENELIRELEFVSKKLGYGVDELVNLVKKPSASHLSFDNAAWMFNHNSRVTQLVRYFLKGELNFSNLLNIMKIKTRVG